MIHFQNVLLKMPILSQKVMRAPTVAPFFSDVFVLEAFFSFILSISVSSSVKRFKPSTKPTISEMNHNITNFVLKKVVKESKENDIICSALCEWAVTDELFCRDFHFCGNSDFFDHAQLRIMVLGRYIFI